MVLVKMVALVLSLGVDTLMMSIPLGLLKTRGKVKIALTFAGAEALMPTLGLIIGQTAGRPIGDWASLVGGLALLAVAMWLMFFEDEDGGEEKLERELAGWSLVLAALSMSLDELAVGFSIGMIGVPVVWTIILIAVQAFLFTLVVSPLGPNSSAASGNGQTSLRAWCSASWACGLPSRRWHTRFIRDVAFWGQGAGPPHLSHTFRWPSCVIGGVGPVAYRCGAPRDRGGHIIGLQMMAMPFIPWPQNSERGVDGSAKTKYSAKQSTAKEWVRWTLRKRFGTYGS